MKDASVQGECLGFGEASPEAAAPRVELRVIPGFKAMSRAMPCEQWRLMLDALPDGVALVQDARIVAANQPFASLLGLASSGALVGAPVDEVLVPGEWRRVQLARAGSTPSTEQEWRIALARRDGTVLPERCRVVPVASSESESWLLLARDVASTVGAVARAPVRAVEGMIGAHPRIREIHQAIREVAPTNASVMITGETGTGKEVTARAIHALSHRAQGPFLAVNCGALAQGVVESELFGHVRGAFTGADRSKRGWFERADGGTLLLDEIGELDLSMQVRLLRVLEERRVDPVGGERSVSIDVRVLAATNRDLQQRVKQGKFREDLYFRLCVVPIEIPPLRERRSDVILIAESILEELRAPPRLTDAVRERLLGWDWPGNVRELLNVLQFAAIRSKGGPIHPQHLPPALAHGGLPRRVGRPPKLERRVVDLALAASGDNRSRAARRLGVSRATLYRFLDRDRG